LEIIVSDNALHTEIEAICVQYSGVEYVRNPEIGQFLNFDNCVSLARGQLVKFLLDDDLLKPNCVSLSVKAYAACPPESKPSLIASSYEGIKEDGTVFRRRGLQISKPYVLFSKGYVQQLMVMLSNNLCGPLTSVTIPAASFEALGANHFRRRAETAVRGLVDLATYIDLGSIGPLLYIRDPLVQVRQNRYQLSNWRSNPDAVLTLTASEAIVREAVGKKLISPEDVPRALEKVAQKYRRWIHVYPHLRREAERIEAEVALAGLLATDPE